MYEIKCYVSSGGKNEIQKVYDEGTDDLQAAFMVELEYLRVGNRKEWRRPHAAKLSECNDFRDFFEIRLFANNVQQRPIGFFGPKTDDFTILLWATEKDRNFKPADWCKIANNRRKQIESGSATAAPIKL